MPKCSALKEFLLLCFNMLEIGRLLTENRLWLLTMAPGQITQHVGMRAGESGM